ncbi:hypothetical protein GCM10023149_33880 [Mucilaginibacter gynuensis]|uniref:DinB-like domain-containing protein n=1 Tax=Mucilaginibacter gynuensis TaxID=1302236 RepID=A0ABP8GSM4_9SPHI
MDHQKELDRTRFFDQLHELAEQPLRQAISVYQNLSIDTLDRPSADGGWSMTQCLEHLNTYHRHYLPLITTTIAKDPGGSSVNVKRGWLGNYFIRLMDPDHKATKYKAMTKHVPAAGLHASEVIAEFMDHQERLSKFKNDILKNFILFGKSSISQR